MSSDTAIANEWGGVPRIRLTIAAKSLKSKMETGRGERIRTSGLYVPNVALYQAKLHPEVSTA